MSYVIYFDESNKLDKPGIHYSYYGALGMEDHVALDIRNFLERLNVQINSSSEMHFTDYTQDTNFEKYFKALHYLLNQLIQMNAHSAYRKKAYKVITVKQVTSENVNNICKISR